MATDLDYTRDYQKLKFGGDGLRVIAALATSAVGENFGMIQATEASTVSFTSNASGGDATVSSLAIAAGVILYGNFKDITCNAGNIVAYLR